MLFRCIDQVCHNHKINCVRFFYEVTICWHCILLVNINIVKFKYQRKRQKNQWSKYGFRSLKALQRCQSKSSRIANIESYRC